MMSHSLASDDVTCGQSCPVSTKLTIISLVTKGQHTPIHTSLFTIFQLNLG